MTEQAQRLGRQLAWRIQVGSFESVCRMVDAGAGIGEFPRRRRCGILRRWGVDDRAGRELIVRERSVLVRELQTLLGCITLPAVWAGNDPRQRQKPSSTILPFALPLSSRAWARRRFSALIRP